MFVQGFALHPSALRGGVVGIADRQWRQGRRFAAEERRVQGREVLEKDPHRQAVTRDVVDLQPQHVVLGRQAQ